MPRRWGVKLLSPTQSPEMLTHSTLGLTPHKRKRREGRNMEKSTKEKSKQGKTRLLVFGGFTTVSAAKHEGDYCVGEFA